MKLPLEGIRIVDLSSVVMGPWASQMLGELGADIIKVESPAGDVTRQMGPAKNPGMAAVFLSTNRHKRSIVLDLQRPEGKEALQRLVVDADVLLHNLRPQAAEKLGISYESFRSQNPKLIHCAAYGFHHAGPMANHPAYDDIIQAASGMAYLVGTISDQPRFVPSIVADKTAAYAVVSKIMAALLQRMHSGQGQALEVTMLETMVDFNLVEHLYGATFDPPIADMGYSRILTRERRPYKTLDGYLTVLPYTDKNWRDFFRIVGREELAEHPDFATMSARVDNADKVYAFLAEAVATRSSAELEAALLEAQIPVMRVNTIEDLLTDEQLQASGFWLEVEHPTEGRLRHTTPALSLRKNPADVERHAPLHGEHSVEILTELGYSSDEIQTLMQTGVSRVPAPSTPTSSNKETTE